MLKQQPAPCLAIVPLAIVMSAVMRSVVLSSAIVSSACVLVFVAGFGRTASGDEPAAPFTPAEISIGEPIALPFADDRGGDQRNAVGSPAPPLRAPADAAVAAAPGTGWLGLSVAESNVPGRWRVDDVLAGGPAARAGMIPGDEVRAINGITLESAEDVAEAMATIAAGQDVPVAVARNDALGDLVLRADPRPAPTTRTTPEPPPAPQQLAQPAPQQPLQATPQQLAPTVPPSFQQVAPQPLAQPAQQSLAQPSSQRFAQPAPQQLAQPAPQQLAQPAQQSLAQPAPQPLAQPASQQPVPPAWQSVGESREPERLPPGRFLPDAAAVPGAPTLDEPRGGRTALGVRTVPIDPAMQARFSLPEPVGAYVIGVVQDLPASRAGVPPGSVIVALNDRPVRSPVELTQLVTSSPIGRPVTVQFILPGGESKRADVVLQPLSAPLEQALTGEPMTTAVPTLEPGPVPQRVERVSGESEQATVLDEVRGLRQRLERLERRLENLRPTLRR
jgi:membrane-associated protease RseP (regulator of RpoE activity)